MANLEQNGTFDANLNHWTPSAPGSAGSVWGRSTTVKRSGAGGAYCLTTGDEPSESFTLTSDGIDVPVGATNVVLDFWSIRADVPGGGSTYQALIKSSGGLTLATVLSTDTGTSGSFSHTTSSNLAATLAGLTGIKIAFVIIGNGDSGPPEMGIDDVTLTYTPAGGTNYDVSFSASTTATIATSASVAGRGAMSVTAAPTIAPSASAAGLGAMSVTAAPTLAVGGASAALGSVGLAASAAVAMGGGAAANATMSLSGAATIDLNGGKVWSVGFDVLAVSSLSLAGSSASVGALAVQANATAALSASAPLRITVHAAASPTSLDTTDTDLSVLADDEAGEASLIYTWSTTAKPSGAANPTFSVNGNNAAKATTAMVSKAGSYTFLVTVRNLSSQTVTSSVSVTAVVTASDILVSPQLVVVPRSGTQQFTAVQRDQFGVALVVQPSFTWGLVSGGVGSISVTGLYTGPSSVGTASVKATA